MCVGVCALPHSPKPSGSPNKGIFVIALGLKSCKGGQQLQLCYFAWPTFFRPSHTADSSVMQTHLSKDSCPCGKTGSSKMLSLLKNTRIGKEVKSEALEPAQ